MTRTFDLVKVSRENYLKIIDEFSVLHINTIPIGFNNNIIWNIAHIVATFDILVYKLSGLDPKISIEFIEEFKKGTKPSRAVNQEFIDQLKINLIEQVTWIESDYLAGKFPAELPKPYMTSFNFELKTIEDVLVFNQVHEALHLGIIMSLRKFV